MSTLDLCEKYFGKRNIYELLNVTKDAGSTELKKGYYELSKKVHPDRVSEAEKHEATEKFKLLSKVYHILIDSNKRALYDDQGIIDDDDDENMESKLNNWLEVWRKIFKPISLDDIENYEKSYVDSELERADIKKSYLNSKGCINQMMNEVPFLKVSEEERLQKIVREMIDAGEVPEYKKFTKENSTKRKRRHQKHERESKIADKLKAKHLQRDRFNKSSEDNNDDLAMAIQRRQQEKATSFDSLMDRLVQKYGNNVEEDDEEFEVSNIKSTNKKNVKKNKNDLHGVKDGKVKKTKKTK